MFNYDASADLYVNRTGMKASQETTDRRFSTAATAIHFAVVHLSPELLQNALLDVDEERFTTDEIRSPYDVTTFPLQRRMRGAS